MIFTLTLNPALDRELTVPEFMFDDVLRASATRIDYGGKGFNISRALAALGAESVALGFVGGPTGERLAEGLDMSGIRTDFVWIADETRTNVSIITEDHARYLKVNECGPTVTPFEQYALHQKVSKLAKPDDWWVMSGSLPHGIPSMFYAELIGVVQAAGAHAVLDTSGDPLRLGCEAGAVLVKPNLAEAAALTGVPLTSEEREMHTALSAIHVLGAQHVVISRGKEGALLFDGEHTWTAEAPAIEERNPIGAGDAMVAGMVWALNQGEPLPAALTWGVACGAAAAGLDGTAVGSRGRVAELVERVHTSCL